MIGDEIRFRIFGDQRSAIFDAHPYYERADIVP